MHTLYRFFNAEGTLLYVGITNDPGRRMTKHRGGKSWWLEVARVEMEQHPDRLALRAAELKAIEHERPLYNIQHNRPAARVAAQPESTPITDETWAFTDRYGRDRTGLRIALYWEAHGDPITDDYTPEDIDAFELLRMWLKYVGSTDIALYGLPKEQVPIFWYLRFSPSPDFGGAPFCEMSKILAKAHGWCVENFFTYFDWPTSEQTGEPINFLTLPVADKLWNHRQANKGGFIQEALQWKPAAYQSSFNPWALAKAAGLL